MGCREIQMSAQKSAGRGIVTSFAPNVNQAYRGELEISDEGFGGADVYDVTVTLQCVGTESSMPMMPVRISCTANSQVTSSGAACHMGRLEVYNRDAMHSTSTEVGTWGTVCGHWLWDNDEPANIACRQLGYGHGQLYTFGSSKMLPTLPIVTGFRLCEGGERTIFDCPERTGGTAEMNDIAERGFAPVDRDCFKGCRGADGIVGTADDSLDPTCTHSIDQGVICEYLSEENRLQHVSPSVNRCESGFAGGCSHGCTIASASSTQPIIFGCIEYFTTKCLFDITNTELANGIGSYMSAVQAFAQCANQQPEPAGYCHASLADASVLSNHEVCLGTTDDPETADVDESKGSITGEMVMLSRLVALSVSLTGYS